MFYPIKFCFTTCQLNQEIDPPPLSRVGILSLILDEGLLMMVNTLHCKSLFPPYRDNTRHDNLSIKRDFGSSVFTWKANNHLLIMFPSERRDWRKWRIFFCSINVCAKHLAISHPISLFISFSLFFFISSPLDQYSIYRMIWCT